MPDELIPLKTEALRAARPDWPWTGFATWKMIAKGQLGHVRVGRRLYLTPALMSDFIAKHTRNEGEYTPETRQYRSRSK